MSAQPQPDATINSASKTRQEAAGLLARANLDELQAALSKFAADEAVVPLKGPETGLIMLRGKIGGGGAAFNLGEATISRASIKLSDGLVGHGHCLGTERAKVQMIAVIDALYQRNEQREQIEALLFSRINTRLEAEKNKQSEETEATRVDFFTMVRGDD